MIDETDMPCNRSLRALRIFTELHPGRYISAKELHELMLENGAYCDYKTARKIWEEIAQEFKRSEQFIVSIVTVRHGKNVPTRAMAIIAGKKN